MQEGTESCVVFSDEITTRRLILAQKKKAYRGSVSRTCGSVCGLTRTNFTITTAFFLYKW
jgi:hypothetical protein